MRDSVLNVPEAHPTAPDPLAFFREITEITVERLTQDLVELGPLKTHLVSSFEVVKDVNVPGMDGAGEIDYDEIQGKTDEAHMRGFAQALTDREAIEEFVASTFVKMVEDLERYTQNGSGWPAC